MRCKKSNERKSQRYRAAYFDDFDDNSRHITEQVVNCWEQSNITFRLSDLVLWFRVSLVTVVTSHKWFGAFLALSLISGP